MTAFFDSLGHDIRFALRSLYRSPLFTATAIAVLALGIGANTALFTVIKGVLLDPLAYPEPEELVVVMESAPEHGLPRFSVSPPNYVDFRDRNTSFEALSAQTGASFNLSGGDGPAERVEAVQVTGNFFELFGLPPSHGRGITPSDDDPGAEQVVVLGHAFWKSRFGGDPEVLGETLSLDGEPYQVVGVAHPELAKRRDLFVALALDYAETGRGSHFLGVRGRLKDGVPIEQAATEMRQIAARLEAEYPDSNTGWTAKVESLHGLMVEDHQGALWMLFGAVALVLLIACANVANLMLGRLAGRERELALRGALGAGRGQIVRQLLTESLMLSGASGALGLLLAWWGTGVLTRMEAADLPRMAQVGVDGGVLVFALVASGVTGVVFGLLPAVRASRPDLVGSLKEGGRGQIGGGGKRLRDGLVVAEVAISMVLLIGAGLLLQSLSKLLAVDPGFDPQGVLVAELNLPSASYTNDEEQAAFYDQLYSRLEALPGVEEVGGVMPLPLTGSGFMLIFQVEGRPIPEPGKETVAHVRVVGADYFDAMGIPEKAGRVIEDADTMSTPKVVVVNESAAEKFFDGREALGQRLTFDDPTSDEARWFEVVGIVGDVHHESLTVATEPEIYWASAQVPFDNTSVVIRAGGAPGALAGPLRQVVNELDPEIALAEVRPMNDLVDDSLAQQRFNGRLLGLFAALALTLATLGLYSVLSVWVAQRLQEIGVRRALGAGTREIVSIVLRQGMGVVGLGLVLGTVGAIAASRALSQSVYEVSPTDPGTYLAVGLLLALVGCGACLLPAWRATQVDPMRVLRDE